MQVFSARAWGDRLSQGPEQGGKGQAVCGHVGGRGDPGLSQDWSCPGVCMPAVSMHLLVYPCVQLLTEKAGAHPGPTE